MKRRYIIRKLTPTECAALQGMPKDWCKNIPKRSDTKEYRLWGNGMAYPCIEHCIKRIAQFENGTLTD